MNWFYEMKRWGRVYICFLLPGIIAGVLFAFRQWIAAGVFLGIMVFILLPLFIDAEEELSKRRHEQIIDHIHKAASSVSSAKVFAPKLNTDPAALTSQPALPSTKTESDPAAETASAAPITRESEEIPSDLPYSLILAAKDNANILIATRDRNKIQARINKLSELLQSTEERELQYRFSIERDTLMRYLTEPRDDTPSH